MAKYIKSNSYEDYENYTITISGPEGDYDFDIAVEPDTDFDDFCMQVEHFCMWDIK